MIDLTDGSRLLNLRRQVAQAMSDAQETLDRARATGRQRAVDHFTGRVVAFQTILDIIDIEVTSKVRPTHDNQ
jgi:hypothetical protein